MTRQWFLSFSFVSSPNSVLPRTVAPPSSRPADQRSVIPKPGQFVPKKSTPVTTIPSPMSTLSLIPNASQSLPPEGKTALRVRVLEVVSPEHFLVHFLEGVNELEKLPALHRSMTEHYGAMPPNTVFK